MNRLGITCKRYVNGILRDHREWAHLTFENWERNRAILDKVIRHHRTLRWISINTHRLGAHLEPFARLVAPQLHGITLVVPYSVDKDIDRQNLPLLITSLSPRLLQKLSVRLQDFEEDICPAILELVESGLPSLKCFKWDVRPIQSAVCIAPVKALLSQTTQRIGQLEEIDIHFDWSDLGYSSLREMLQDLHSKFGKSLRKLDLGEDPGEFLQLLGLTDNDDGDVEESETQIDADKCDAKCKDITGFPLSVIRIGSGSLVSLLRQSRSAFSKLDSGTYSQLFEKCHGDETPEMQSSALYRSVAFVPSSPNNPNIVKFVLDKCETWIPTYALRMERSLTRTLEESWNSSDHSAADRKRSMELLKALFIHFPSCMEHLQYDHTFWELHPHHEWLEAEGLTRSHFLRSGSKTIERYFNTPPKRHGLAVLKQIEKQLYTDDAFDQVPRCLLQLWQQRFNGASVIEYIFNEDRPGIVEYWCRQQNFNHLFESKALQSLFAIPNIVQLLICIAIRRGEEEKSLALIRALVQTKGNNAAEIDVAWKKLESAVDSLKDPESKVAINEKEIHSLTEVVWKVSLTYSTAQERLRAHLERLIQVFPCVPTYVKEFTLKKSAVIPYKASPNATTLRAVLSRLVTKKTDSF
jgi:hypothetical protein